MQASRLAKGISNYPSKVFFAKKCPEKLSVIGSEAIGKMKKYLSNDLRTENATILDASPGDGILSRSLLDAGLPTIHVFEKLDEDLNPTSKLKGLKSDFASRVHIHDTGYSRCDDDNLTEVITKIALCDSWPQKPPLKVILSLSPMKEHQAINYFLLQFANQTGLYSCARPELYLFVSYFQAASIAADYRAKNHMMYRFRAVLVQSLFDTEFLDKVPWRELDPLLPIKKVKKKSDDFFDDYENSFLIKLTPKENLPSLIPLELLPEYRFFAVQSMIKRSNYLIPYFEKWFPGCGPRLIKEGIPLFSKFGDTSPNTFLQLFNLITQWPEYSTSTFKAASNSEITSIASHDEPEDDLLLATPSPEPSESL